MVYSRAKDIMVPINQFAAVKESDTLKTALLVLHDALTSGKVGHRTLAVLNEKGDLVGFLTVRSILKSLEILAYKQYLQEETQQRFSLTGFWHRLFLKNKLEKITVMKVKEAMRPVEKVFVSEETPLPEVAKVILKNRVNHIPVVNSNNKVIGIVRSVDLLDVMDRFLEE